jgi:hypothetical protein
MSDRQDRQTGEGKQRNPPPPPQSAIIQIFRAFEGYYHQHQQEKDERETQRHRNETMIAQWTRKLGIFTCILAVITGGTAYILWKTDQTLRDTLEANKLEQRAWVFSKIEISDSLKFENKAPNITLTVDLMNTGKLPASAAFVWAHIYSQNSMMSLADMKTRPIACMNPNASWNVGIALFPGQISTLTPLVVGPPFDQQTAPDGPISLIIAGCILYLSAADRTTHRTPFVLAVAHQAGDFVFNNEMPPLDKSTLSLSSMPSNEQPE